MEKNYVKRFLELKNEIKVPKTKDNKYGGFKYRNLEQIQEVLKPLELKYGLLFWSTEEIVFLEDNTRHCVVSLNVIDVETGNVVLTTKSSAEYQKADGSTKMNASQLSGSASSYACKYAYARALGLDDTKDADHEELTEEKPKVKNEIVKEDANSVETKEHTPEEKEELDLKKRLYQLQVSTMKANTAEEINELLDQLNEIGGDEKARRIITVKAESLKLKRNIKTGQYFELKESE